MFYSSPRVGSFPWKITIDWVDWVGSEAKGAAPYTVSRLRDRVVHSIYLDFELD